MNWIVLALVSAVFESAKDTYGKISSIKTNEFTSGIALHFFSLIFSLIYMVIFADFPAITKSFWIGSLAFLFITPAWTILYMKALKLTDLSISLPMMAFNPIFTALLNYGFKGGVITTNGWIGILSISIGVYFVNIKKESATYILAPIKNMFSDKGALAMLGVAALWSFGAHFSKMRVDGSSPAFSTLSGAVIGVVTTYLLGIYQKQDISLTQFTKNIKVLAPVGIFYYLATFISSMALQTGSTAYVFALKRGSIITSSLVGKFVFHESYTIYKYLGLALTFSGIVLLAIS